jgi:hypothetical protein
MILKAEPQLPVQYPIYLLRMRGKIDPKCYNGMDKFPACYEQKKRIFVPALRGLTMNFQSRRADLTV